MLYDVRGHALLSPEAAALEAEALAQHALIAELVLGLKSPAAYTGTDAELAADAVARQVSLQVKLNPDVQTLSGWAQDGRSEDHRDALPEIDAFAARIMSRLPAHGRISDTERYSTWATVRTDRPVSRALNYGEYTRSVVPRGQR